MTSPEVNALAFNVSIPEHIRWRDAEIDALIDAAAGEAARLWAGHRGLDG